MPGGTAVRSLLMLSSALLLIVACAGAPVTTSAPTASPTAMAAPSPTPVPPTSAPVQPTAPPAAPTGAPGAGGTDVTIVDFSFRPSTLDVAVGAQVTWTNTGSAPHTVTFTDGEDSGALDTGQTYSRTFDTAGDFDYICEIHPSMRGSVTVGP
jgi:plastocyanin